jgi:hypothetical protein
MRITTKTHFILIAAAAFVLSGTSTAWARDIEYKGNEITVNVNPGEPTQIQFPGIVASGFKKRLSAITVDKKDSDLVVFATDALNDNGEGLIVRLEDGRSYAVRVRRAMDGAPRDDVAKIVDYRSGIDEEGPDTPLHKEKRFDYAPPTQVSGLMREMVLIGEFGKAKVPGYQIIERPEGDVVLDDGTVRATVEKIIMGPNLWGYVLNAENKLDTNQRINPASFRIDGTRAVSIQNWDLAGRPLNVEQEYAGKHRTKVYIVARARKLS